MIVHAPLPTVGPALQKMLMIGSARALTYPLKPRHLSAGWRLHSQQAWEVAVAKSVSCDYMVAPADIKDNRGSSSPCRMPWRSAVAVTVTAANVH